MISAMRGSWRRPRIHSGRSRALGAGVGAGIYSDFSEAFQGLNKLHEEWPQAATVKSYDEAYSQWKEILMNEI